jgi:DNA invertase Pin-like site-specific DNA recombinase
MGMWLRVSTKHQDSENQRPDLERFFLANRYQNAKTYQLDGASAYHGKQEKLIQESLADIRAGTINGVVVWCADRIERRGIEETLALMRRYREAGGRLESVLEPYLNGDGPTAELLASVAAFVAHMESVRKSERQEIHSEKRANAGSPPNKPAYGYKNAKAADGTVWRIPDGLVDEPGYLAAMPHWPPLTDDMLIPDSPAAIIRELFRRYAAGDGASILMADLIRRGIPTPAGGTRWLDSSIRRTLERHSYAAIPVLDGEPLTDVPAQWPALITTELYWSVRLRAATQKDAWGRQFREGKGPYLMAATALCDGCGGRLERSPTYRKDGKHPDGRTRRVRNGSCYACHNPLCTRKVSVGQEELDQFVRDEMALWLARPDVQAALETASHSEERARWLAESKRLQTERDKNQKAYAAGTISAELAGPRQAELDKQIRDAEDSARKAGLPAELAQLAEEDGSLKNGPLKFARLPVLQQRAVVRRVADIRVRQVGKGLNNGQRQEPVRNRVSWRWIIGPEASELPPLPARLTETPRQRIRALLLSEPTFRQLNHAEIAMKIDVAPDTVRFACDSLIKDGTLSECTHRLSRDGKMYGQRLTVEGGLIWNALLTDPELSRLSHTAIAARLSVTPNLVLRTCRALICAGKLSECTHILNEDGTVYARAHAVSRKWKAQAAARTEPEPSKKPDYVLARRLAIPRLLTDGYSQQRIAARYGVSRAAIQRDVLWCRENGLLEQLRVWPDHIVSATHRGGDQLCLAQQRQRALSRADRHAVVLRQRLG